MNEELIKKIGEYVKTHIGEFHEKRIEAVKNLKLEKILKRKNPYLFKTKNCLTAETIVRSFSDAHISSAEETIFGNWLEQLAIFVCKQVYNGRKSSAEGIDLEFEKDGTVYLVSIKSGPNWANSEQLRKMKASFEKAKRVLRTSGAKSNICAVNGCCYGKEGTCDKGAYFKLCGQRFWEFISGESSLYVDIIEPLGTCAHEKNEQFHIEYGKMINVFTTDFSAKFCTAAGEIDWEKLVEFNSGR